MPIDLNNLKIALVHDWLTNIGGAEKVLKAFSEIFPNAPVFVFFYDKIFTHDFLPHTRIRPTKIQNIYQKHLGQKWIIPFSPLISESINLSGYDLIISVSPLAKGIILGKDTIHISYCHSPTRQLWDWQSEYRAEKHSVSPRFISLFQHFFRIWDRHASTRVDYFIANSENTQKRIKKYYNCDSTVIYPPVVDRFCSDENESGRQLNSHKSEKKNMFLIVSRLFQHKNIHIAVRAFNKLGWPLIIIGDGPDLKKLKSIAENNIVFLGYQTDAQIDNYYKECTAFVMPQEEDFGIASIEALYNGKPILALRCGGALEYVREGINGEYFDNPAEEMLADAARRLLENYLQYDRVVIRESAERFSQKRFGVEINNYIQGILETKNAPCA